MILKSLKLENIRSYTDQAIKFPLGTTLFEGDIGSGKSTILMAIEFALFGLGSEKGGGLLRTGVKKGSVTLTFEVEGEEYEIYRCLERKGKSVHQSECHLKTKEGDLPLSASEIKEKILEVLKFNEPPDPKAQSVIYRYAVFTPQEEMKAILWMRPDARLQTLRKAFRIEDYRIAMENSSVLAKSIKEKSIELTSHASDLEDKRETHKTKVVEIGDCKGHLTSLTKSEGELEGKLAKLKEEVDEHQKRKDALGKAVGEIPLLTKQIEEKNGEITELQDEAKQLSKEIEEELQPDIDKLNEIKKPTTKTEKELKEELEELRDREKELRKVETSIDTKITDYESVEKNKVCPTCDRPADPKEFEEKIKQKMKEKEKASEEVSNCGKRIKEIEKLQDLLREYEKAQERLQVLNEKVKRHNERIEKASTKAKTLKAYVEEASKKLEKAKGEVEEFNQVSERIEKLSKERDGVQSELKTIGEEISKTRETLRLLKKEVDELGIEIETKEKERKLAEKLKEYNIWLEEFFVPTLDTIEKHVMLSIKEEFNQHFQKWWNLLVEDPGKESRIDEDFTPFVEQDGYEQDIYYLSGGEKTSLALAYRLALNSIVKKVSTGIKSNLLILDEPTDGFSKEQLFKIREILDEIQCPQIIIVSHEKELESFADQVLRVEKKQGASEIKMA
jgi:exonuclease SbcC